MSVNLDKSLDDIVVGRRQDARRRGSRRNKASTATGGVKKNKATKAATGKGAKSAPAPAPKDSKIMVSGMVGLHSVLERSLFLWPTADLCSLPM